jgi:hypothetical protein
MSFAVGLTWAFPVPQVAGFPDIAGPELWIDGPDAVQLGWDRSFPDVAVDELGRRIHVWEVGGIGGFSAPEIFVRRWDANGNPLADPVMVNTTTDNTQRYARVAASADGSFLVIFQSFDPITPGDVNLRIVVRSQAYDSSGATVGSEQRLSTVPTNGTTNDYADVAALRVTDGSPGGYVVVWRSSSSAGSDTNWSIQGCLVSAAGVPSAQFQVNSQNAPNQNIPSVTELPDGGFFAMWVADQEMWGRRFNAAGGPIGNDFKISSSFVSLKEDNDVALGWDGTVAAVWSDAEGDGGTNGKEIRARLFDSDLNPLGADFRVNTVIDGGQENPRLAEYGPMGFLVVWKSDVSSGTDPGTSIEARLVTGPNQFAGPQVQYNVWENSTQHFPGAHGWYGRLATNWRTLTWDGDPTPDNTNDNFIIGRDVEYCLFCDDFEWGGEWRWSSSVD